VIRKVGNPYAPPAHMISITTYYRKPNPAVPPSQSRQQRKEKSPLKFPNNSVAKGRYQQVPEEDEASWCDWDIPLIE